MRRFGQVIRVRPEAVDAYERLHAEPWPGVLAAIAAANIRNYSIYRHEDVLFAYFEYIGDDLEGDMARMAADPIIVEWWAHHGRDAGPVSGARPGRVVADARRDLPCDIGRSVGGGSPC